MKEYKNEKDMDVELDITLTITRRVKITVDDYDVEEEYDDDGNLEVIVDTSSCDFENHIYEQVEIPEGWEVVHVDYEEVNF